MAITRVQSKTPAGGQAGSVSSTFTATFDSSVTAGNLLVACVHVLNGVSTVAVADNVNGSWTKDVDATPNPNVGFICQIWSFPNAASGATTVTLTMSDQYACSMTIFELAGAATVSHVDTSSSDQRNASPTLSLTTAANSCIIATMNTYNSAWTVGVGVGDSYTLQQVQAVASAVQHADEYLLSASASSHTVDFVISGSGAGPYAVMAAAAYKIGATSTPLSMFGGN